MNTDKSCKKVAFRQDKAAALKAYRISRFFLFCNIYKQTKNGFCLQIFAAVILRNIIIIGQHSTQ